MALYCPQGSGILRQQLIMMHGIAWCFMVLRILYVFTKVNLWVTFTRDLNAIHNYRYQEKAVQCYRNQHWKPVSYHTVGKEGQEEACAPRDLSHHGDLDHNRQRHLFPPVM